MMKRLLTATIATAFLMAHAAPALAVNPNYVGASLGIAQYVNPATATTLATTPTTGVVAPAATKTIIVTIEGAPIRYFFNASTAPTGTVGNKLDIGSYTINNEPALITAFKFINDSSGTATVTVEYLGQ